MLALSLPSLLLASLTFAGPSPRRKTCNVPASALSLPAPFTTPSSTPSFVTIGVGVQNYTCTAAGNYSSIGAVAQLFDISCLHGTPEFGKIQNDTYASWSECPSSNPLDSQLVDLVEHKWHINLLGQHYFISQNGTLFPKFDFTSTQHNPNAYVVASKAGDIPAPTGHQDVDWLDLKAVSGKLATEVFRVFTRAGQPPASCTPGTPPISVKYTAQYWFEGSSL
ncbi:hypothetical protein BJV74DRAFT_882781 [Russula compacta]|nr:hypothetical protein BJV74DRAFT_882781 [Russula compacta]